MTQTLYVYPYVPTTGKPDSALPATGLQPPQLQPILADSASSGSMSETPPVTVTQQGEEPNNKLFEIIRLCTKTGLHNSPEYALPKTCGNELLDKILSEVRPVGEIANQYQYAKLGQEGVLMAAAGQTVMAAKRINHVLSYQNGIYYVHTGMYFQPISAVEMRNFIILASVKYGVPSYVARNAKSLKVLEKQFKIEIGLHRANVGDNHHNDPFCAWLEATGYCVGVNSHIPLAKAFKSYNQFCRLNRHVPQVTYRSFAIRLREKGFTTKKQNDGQHLYFSLKDKEQQL